MIALRRVVFVALALLASCFPPGGAPYADRGIGGTGAPAGPEISDRGIGGTGIAGVITGFGSVFVDGLEIAYTPSTPVTVDGEPDPQAALQVGQTAAIVASEDHGLHAVSISLRHAVSGPVTSVGAPGPGGQLVTVAGQQVMLGSDTEGLQTVRPGDWIAVSGLRQPNGVIAASRIDQRTPGEVLVRGPVTQSAGGWHIGGLAVQPPEGFHVAPGDSATIRGTLVNGTLSGMTARPDVLDTDPAAFFGGNVRRMVVEGYVSAAAGRIRLGRGAFAAPAPGIAAAAGPHLGIVDFERGADGRFVATHLQRAEMHLQRPEMHAQRPEMHPQRAERPGVPHRAPGPGPRAFGGRPGMAPHAFRPRPGRPHPWPHGHPGYGRRGEHAPHRGCAEGECRRERRPP